MDTGSAGGKQSLLDYVQRIDAAAIAYGYEVWADGVFQQDEGAADLSASAAPSRYLPGPARQSREQITTRPLWISGLGHTIDTDEPLVQLSYGTIDGRIAQVWLARGAVTEHHLLQKLGGLGLPIDSLNVKKVLVYLRDTEALNSKALPHLLVGHRTGPYTLPGGSRGWLLGQRWIGPSQTQIHPDPRENTRYMAAFQPKGNRTYWYDWWRYLYNHRWVTRWLIATSFAAPLLRLLNARTFFVHHWGDSSSGKTAILSFGQSVWGNSEMLYSSMNSTEIALTEIFQHVTDIPVAYDEKQVATIDTAQMIYAVCLPTGRERGAKDGGLRTDRQSWLTIARTTGEVPLVGKSDVGGQSNRVLQVHSPAFDTQPEGERIYAVIREHHGFAGPEFLGHLAKLIETPEGLAWLREFQQHMRAEIAKRVERDGNHTVYVAVIATAQALSAHWLLGIPLQAAITTAIEDAVVAFKQTAPESRLPYADRALLLLRDHWLANPMQYGNAMDDQLRDRLVQADLRMVRLVGVASAHGMAYIPTEADRILREAHFSTERVWRDFADRGWIFNVPGSTTLTVPVALRGDQSPKHPCYYVKSEVFFPGRWAATPEPVPDDQPPQGQRVIVAGNLRLVAP